MSKKGILRDFTDGELFKSWLKPGQVFGGNEPDLCVSLSLFTDGVNPNKNMVWENSVASFTDLDYIATITETASWPNAIDGNYSQ